MPRIIRVSPDETSPTHHISLSDGIDTVGLIMCTSDLSANGLAISRAAVPRTAMKTTTGNQKYSDFEPPWSPLAQDNWGGGRGSLEYERDVTRYYDGHNINTVFEYVSNSGLPRYTEGLRSAQRHLPGSVGWVALTANSRNYKATRIDVTTTFTAKKLMLLIKKIGEPGDLNISLCGNSAGYPGTALWSDTVTRNDVDDWASRWLDFGINLSLTSGDTIWLVVHAAGDQANHWLLGYANTGIVSGSQESADGSSWSDSGYDAYYDLRDALTNKPGRFFRYRNQQYFYRNDLAGGAPTIYQNGERGKATGPGTGNNQLEDTGKTWATDLWAGWYVWIIQGKGMSQRIPYRKIVNNNVNTLTLETDWDILPDSTTEYVIVGGDTWYEVTGHGITKPITDYMVVNDILYFALGDSNNIRRGRWNAGAWTWADDGTNKAEFLCLVNESSGPVIWRANNVDANSKISVSYSGVKAWATNLSFGTAIEFNDDKGTINSLEEYGDTYRYLWVFRDASVYSIEKDSTGSTYAALEMPLREMSALSRDTNGVAHAVHNVYMYFNLGPGIERYYQRTLDDVGPNRDEGLPANRQGYCSAIIGYPGRYFAAYNAGDGYSSIMSFNGVGWNEVYRAELPGHYIDSMQFQPGLGNELGRLWVHVGDDVLWLPFPTRSLDPTKDNAFMYTWEGELVSGWMSAGMVDIYKLLHSVKIFADNLSEDKQWVEVDYQLDQETSWTPMPDKFYVSPVSEVKFAGTGETAKRFRYRIRLLTTDKMVSPQVRTVVVETISRVPIKYSFSFPYRLVERDVDLQGERETQDLSKKRELLDRWAAQLTPLTMRSLHEAYDNQTVFIDPSSHTPGLEHSEGYVAKLTVIQV